MIYYSNDLGFTQTKISDSQVELTDDEWASLVVGQADGKVIITGEGGIPALTNPPALTDEQLVAIAESKKASLMAAAGIKIAPLQDAVDLGTATDTELASLKSWKEYRVSVNRVDTASSSIIWPEGPSS